MKYFYIILLVCLPVLRLQSINNKANNKKSEIAKGVVETAQKQVYFTENKGQIHDGFFHRRQDILFVGNAPSQQMVISRTGVSHQLKRIEVESKPIEGYVLKKTLSVKEATFYRVDMNWVGVNPGIGALTYSPSRDYSNYYNLPYADEGILGVRTYESVRLTSIYHGIDVRYYANGQQIEYDYEVAAGADYRQIRIEILGAEPQINANGDLVMTTPMGVISESAPKVFQNGKLLKSRWKQISKSIWGFEIDNYNPEMAMLIDPLTRVWGTYYGGEKNDQLWDASVDNANNVLISGQTISSNNIATTGAHQTSLSGTKQDGLIVKLNSAGQRLWATYYGGQNDDNIYGLAVDQNCEIIVSGSTMSTTNIATVGSFQSSFTGSTFYSDGLIAKFDSTGAIIWGSYYGLANTGENFNCLNIDNSGNIYAAGTSNSSSGLATSGTHQTSNSAGAAGIVVKFSPSGSRIWGTYFSGINATTFYNIVIDKYFNVYGAGRTTSTTGIGTVNVHQSGSGGGSGDAFLVKFYPNGTRQWGTYYGGSGSDWIFGVCLDSFKNVIVVGNTTSPNNIASSGAHRTIFNNTANDAFIAKFDSLGYRTWGTYYGGNGRNEFEAVCAADNGDLYIVGNTDSPSDIATSDAYKVYFTGNVGSTDATLVKFSPNGVRQLGSYYGGIDTDLFTDVCIGVSGELYCFGTTASDTGIASSGAYQTTYGGNNLSSPCDAMVVKFGLCQASSKAISVNACKSYKWHGTTYTQSGDYIYKTTNYKGCDSVVTLKLKVLNTVTGKTKITACDSFVWKGKSYYSDISLFDTLKSYQNCDSILEKQIKIVFPSFDSLDVKICHYYVLKKDTIKQSGVYYDTTTNYQGCDSITKLFVTIYPSISKTIKMQVCKRYVWHGSNYDSTGVYTKKLKSYLGCDSIVKLNLVVNKYFYDTSAQSSCNRQYIWRNKTFKQTGLYMDTVVVGSGCDSIHVLKLAVVPLGFSVQCKDAYKTIGKSALFYIKSTAANLTYQWQSDQGAGWINLSDAGQYSGVLTDTLRVFNVLQINDNYKFRCIIRSGQCADTSKVASLYVCPLISEQPVKKYCGVGGSTFFQVKCDIPNASFQWQADNGSGFQNLSNAGLYSGVTTNLLKVRGVAYSDNNTIYRCLVTYSKCQDTTDAVALIVLDKNSENLCNNHSFVSVFPNPTNNFVNVLLPSEKVGLPYKIIDDLGQIISIGKIQSETSTIDFKEYPSGVYLLTIGDELLDCFKIVKIWEK